MALPKSRNKKVVSSTIKTSHKLISGLLAFIYIFQIRLYKLDESYTPKSLTFKLSSTKLTRISDSTTQLDAIQTINVDSSSSMDKQRSSNGTIPKFLWMFWDKGLDHLQSLSNDPKNKYAVDYQCVQSMMKLNSNTWDVKLLDESGAKSLAPIYASLLNNDTFYPKMTPTMKGDVLRLELLSRYGGVYADTSICAFAELDSFITDWVGTDKDGFWAAPKDIAKKNSSKLQSLHVDKCHDLSLLPAKRQGSKNKGAPSRTTSNWFLASTNPHNPLVDEWLRVYVNHLLTLADPTQPYFLAHCSLSQARMNNATVERIWSATTKRIQTLGKTSSSYKSKCITGGVSSCSTIVKRPSRDYVLSGKYAHDVFGTPYHPKLMGKNSTFNATPESGNMIKISTSDSTSTTHSIDNLHAVIHMGIHKTGTTTIQSQAKQLQHLLKLDGYEQPNGAGEQLHTRFATCFMDWKKKQREKKSEQCNIYTDDSYCMGGQACKPSMVEYGKDIASRGRNLFVSAESMADMSNEDMSRLSQYLKPWKKVTIVVFYRRYYDWLSSLYNQITKTRKLKDSQLWESSIVDFIESNVDHVRPIYTTELLNRIKEESTFDNVVVMNYHDGGSTDKRGSDCALFCNEALNMTHTCDGLITATKQLNSGVDNMEYSDLAFAAKKAGLIGVNTDSKMKEVARAFHKHHKDTLNGTTFKRICPSADVLDKLWNMTVAFENELFPDSAVDQTLEEMRQDFNEASQAKLCKIDVDETLKDPLWLDFIKTMYKKEDKGIHSVTSYGYHPPRPPFTPLVHVSHNCTLSNGKKVHIPVALPHIILIGTQKGGTGTLKKMLKSNPDVVTPITLKELRFLDDEVVTNTPGGWLNETDEGELCRLRKAYADEFNMKQMIPERDGQVRIAFEKTPSYLLRPTIPHAIDLLCPHKPKILVTLRHPAERAFSQYSMIVKQGNHLLPNTTFEQAIETEVDHLIQRGLLRERTLSLSEYEQRRDEFDFDNIGSTSLSPINLQDISLEEYAKVASNVLLNNETVSGGITDSGQYFPHLLFRGMYALQLVPWVKMFGQDERLMILRIEEFASEEANQTEVEEKILLFAGLTNPVLKERSRQVKANGFTKSEMNPITKEYLTWLYQPFNDLLPTLLGEEWRGVWDEVNGSEQKVPVRIAK